MIHARQSDRSGMTAQARRRILPLLAGLVPLVTACGDNGTTDPEAYRFGHIGRIEVTLEAPLRLGDGQLSQTLVWASSGGWSLREAISYSGLEGDETLQRSTGDPSQFVSAYGSLITQLNEVDALKLFVADSILRPALSPECGPTRTRITFTIRDDARDESVTWKQCADGSLSNISPEGAGPDPGAARLVIGTLLAREATVGDKWVSAYNGSVPFGTLDRGDDSGSSITTPVTFIDGGGFASFWGEHAPGRPLPTVDFSKEMVVVGLVGVRDEAGESVEIRRILQVDLGTVTHVFRRVPGDFCSPVARKHVPYHIVVAPRTPIPHRFAELKVEYVSCGG
jgi:hypothetical protein